MGFHHLLTLSDRLLILSDIYSLSLTIYSLSRQSLGDAHKVSALILRAQLAMLRNDNANASDTLASITQIPGTAPAVFLFHSPFPLSIFSFFSPFTDSDNL